MGGTRDGSVGPELLDLCILDRGSLGQERLV
jgi:hypothetical protein